MPKGTNESSTDPYISQGFQAAFEHQIKMQVDVYGDGTPLGKYDPQRKIEFVKDQYIALVMEMGEALDEIGWKPWASSKHFNRDAFKGELVDVLHFFFNLMGVAEITPEELIDDYFKKAAKNLKRQQDGYDGVSTKCPGCHRALDDTAVKCHEMGVFWAANAHVFWCDQLAKEVSRPLGEEN